MKEISVMANFMETEQFMIQVMEASISIFIRVSGEMGQERVMAIIFTLIKHSI